MAIPKRSKRLSALGSRLAGAAGVSGASALPQLDTKQANFDRMYSAAFGKNSQSLATAEGVIPLPDEEELERVKRRKAARRGGGRASTVLSDENRLGG